jgi:hypothetical protein
VDKALHSAEVEDIEAQKTHEIKSPIIPTGKWFRI